MEANKPNALTLALDSPQDFSLLVIRFIVFNPPVTWLSKTRNR